MVKPNHSKEDCCMDRDQLIKELEEYLQNREEQLNRERYQSYNYGYVAGEVSGVRKVLKIVMKEQ